MKVIIGQNEKISTLIAEQVIEKIKQKPNSVIGLATGTSPLEIYRTLVRAYQNGQVSFKDVVTFNLDEYIGLSATHPQSYAYFINEHLIKHLDINKANVHVLKGVGDYEACASNYDQQIENYGGIDLQILGLGSDGHIAFNEPGTSFDSLTHVTKLAAMTINDNSRFFNGNNAEVPNKVITMGLKSIMNAKKIVLIATGKHKAKAVYDLIKGPVSEAIPCSVLKRHPDCTIYVDEEAYSLVK
ncbi:MAG: glucosamine-6-phosphate deaminase [Erysipelotrichia bacterium]|nr:glucosamine-6-phosphate deaminase [Erysipelotrichia bacterium]